MFCAFFVRFEVKMSEGDLLYGTNLSIESMKVIAESIGVGNLPDEAAKELADDISYRLKIILQESAKFMHHAKRQKLTCTDIDNALKMKNVEVGLVLRRMKTKHNLIFVTATIWVLFERIYTFSVCLWRRQRAALH